MMSIKKTLLAFALSACLVPMAASAHAEATGFKHVEWSKNANIYEVNLRQYTQEGTIAAFEKQIPRLQAMGVKILWIMPAQPIGKLNRKGTLGSYYSISDYTAVNPEFGTLADFKHMVATAHKAGMHVILDWVANHTAWDHPWVKAHPEWYRKDAKGQVSAVTFGEGANADTWADVAWLDYSQRPLWDAMTDAMKFWMRETDIDGFRCDVASFVPTPFWEHVRSELDAIRPVFMLAEADLPELHRKAFDMSYDWTLFDLMKRIAKGKANAEHLRAYLAESHRKYPADAYRMEFTGNHDSNSWDGSDEELFGHKAFKAFAVLAATMPGMPLIYSGQESFHDKKLEFFEKDPIKWKQYELQGFYKDLLKLKHDNRALWSGTDGGEVEILPATNKSVFAFRRTKNGNVVTVTINLSGEKQEVAGASKLVLDPWAWKIEVR
jgi:glycosidase